MRKKRGLTLTVRVKKKINNGNRSNIHSKLRTNNFIVESKNEFGKDDEEKEEDKEVEQFGDDVHNDFDTPQFIGRLGTLAYIDFQEF